MRTPQYTPSCPEVTGWAVTTLLEALGWTATRRRLGPRQLLQLLVRAAVALRSLSAVVREARGVKPYLRKARFFCRQDRVQDRDRPAAKVFPKVFPKVRPKVLRCSPRPVRS